jgi:hypothetical protein
MFPLLVSDDMGEYLVHRYIARREEGNAEVKSYGLVFKDFAVEMGMKIIE